MDKHKEKELEHKGKGDTAVNMLVDIYRYIQVHRKQGPPKLPHPPGASSGPSLD